MLAFRSIRWRLQLWYGLLTGALLTAFAVTIYDMERTRRLEQIDTELERLATEFNLGNREPPPPGPRGAPPRLGGPRPITEIYTREHAARGIYYALWSRNRGFAAIAENAPPGIEKPAGHGLRWDGPRREAFLEGNPGDVTLAGRDVSAELAALHRFGWKIATGALGTWILTLLVGSWLVARALRPIHAIGAAAQKIATGDLAQRIDTRDTETELGQLAAVLNSTFARLESSFAQQARFTADAAHELRTPVSVILTHTQNTLGAADLPPEQRAALEAVQRAAQRMRRLIESLLRLARLDGGQEHLARTPLDLASVARESLELIGPLAAARGIAVHADLAPAPVSGDRDGLGQVVTNLLANAVHHNRDAGEIHVSTRVENGHAVVAVADRGPGIAPEHLPRLFERFFRADKARTAAAGRTGLGLAIAKAIVDAHGGAIAVASEFGHGATFTVRLPSPSAATRST
jgi:heavy metal sensor kinase